MFCFLAQMILHYLLLLFLQVFVAAHSHSLSRWHSLARGHLCVYCCFHYWARQPHTHHKKILFAKAFSTLPIISYSYPTDVRTRCCSCCCSHRPTTLEEEGSLSIARSSAALHCTSTFAPAAVLTMCSQRVTRSPLSTPKARKQRHSAGARVQLSGLALEQELGSRPMALLLLLPEPSATSSPERTALMLVRGKTSGSLAA